MPILEAAFEPQENNQSLDHLIHQKVLIDQVLDDVSLRGGKVFRMLLLPDWCKYTSSPSPYALGIAGSYSVYSVPPEAREHRDIAAILEVRFPYSLGTSTSGSFMNECSLQGNTLNSLACSILQAQTYANLASSPTGVLMPGNIIKLEPPQFNFIPWQVTVRLKYDEQFSGMDVSPAYPFVQLCEQAVKAYIYQKLIFTIESNFVYRGMELGVMKEIVSDYRDAMEKYDELLLALGGAEVFDPMRMLGILRRCVPKK